MEKKPIRTEDDYTVAIHRIEKLWGAEKNSRGEDELDLLCTIVEAWEIKHFPILPPDPVDAIVFRMEQMNLTKSDLAKYIGSPSRVREVLGRKRQLTLKMVKSLCKGLEIPAEILFA